MLIAAIAREAVIAVGGVQYRFLRTLLIEFTIKLNLHSAYTYLT